VGVHSPPKTTLRNWQLCVDALHPESFGILKEVCNSSESGVDGKAVTLTYLTRNDFKGFSPLKQGLCIRLLSRQVKEMSVFVAKTTSVVCIALRTLLYGSVQCKTIAYPKSFCVVFACTCIRAPFVTTEIDHKKTPVLQQWRPFTHPYSLVYCRQSSPSFLSRSVCRFKHLNKKSPTPKDYDAIDKDARVSETFVRSVIQVVPSEEWTPELTR